MYFTPTKRTLNRSSLFILIAVLFFSCQKTLDFENSGGNPGLPDLSTKISSSVSGFVTDENDAAVMGASVQFGSNTVTTDKYGYFEAKNVQVVKEAAVVTVSKAGYFKGIKTYIAKEGKAAFFRIKLIPKTSAGTITASSGGTVTLANGLSIKLPAGGIVNAATNTAYTGAVNVAAYWINPTAADLNRIMPGDLRGLNSEGSLQVLQTFGMAAVELTGAAGELLQIANGQKATLIFPIPSSLSSTAPASIPLWYFDEGKGLWKQEGSATKTGNTYVGEVNHFSFWNCDVPSNFVQFNCTLKNVHGTPLPYTLVKLTVVGTNNSGWGYTDSSGYVSGAVPANSNLLLEVLPNFNCTTPLYSQTFTTTNVNISLGVITVTTTNNTANFTGTVTNCANTPVTNGYIILAEGTTYTRYPLNNLGAYTFSKLFCSFPQTVILIGEDITNAQQSASITYVVNAGSNTVANIQACGNSIQQFVNYTVNGTPYSFTAPVDSVFIGQGNGNSIVIIQGSQIGGSSNNYMFFSFDSQGIAVNSTHPIVGVSCPQMNQNTNPNPVLVNITEYGAIGQFISGNFSGTFVELGAPPNTIYNVTCNFRVRRTF